MTKSGLFCVKSRGVFAYSRRALNRRSVAPPKKPSLSSEEPDAIESTVGNLGLLGTGVSKGFKGEEWRKKHFFSTEIPFFGGVILFQVHFLELWKISVCLFILLVMSWLRFCGI